MSTMLDYPQAGGNDWGVQLTDSFAGDFQVAVEPVSLRRQSSSFADLEEQMIRYETEHQSLVTDVRAQYVMLDEASVISFLHSRRAIPQLLLEARPHLTKHFGYNAVFCIRCMTDESGTQTLYAVVMWSGPSAEARSAIRKFDDEWWITNSRYAAGYLTFTYELI